ncbi:MAG: helix-turn-helix domain-containing protein [Candidatus Marinimicrobia bacterium]|nr:helix-turn-helix domain-containing protein [Candidatus Neomarinimicrobiota bacterium]
MHIKPIKTEADYQKALSQVDGLWTAKKGTPEGDILEVLTILIEDYENQHHEIVSPNPIDAIKFRMEQLGLKKIDLAKYLGGRNRVTEILQGKRNLTVKMLTKLHKEFGIPAESLLG